MISSLQATFPNFHIPPEERALCSEFSFYFFNIITLGIFGALKTAELDDRCQNLQHRQIHLMNQQELINQRKERLLNSIQHYSSSILNQSPCSNINFNDLASQKNMIYNGNHSSHYYTDVAVCFRVFLNIFTLGIYACLEKKLLSRQILQLQVENNFLSQQIQEYGTQANLKYTTELEGLKKLYNTSLQETDPAKIQALFDQAQTNQRTDLHDLNQMSTQLQTQKIKLDELAHFTIKEVPVQDEINKLDEKIAAAHSSISAFALMQNHLNKIPANQFGAIGREVKLSDGQVIRPPDHTINGIYCEKHQGLKNAYKVIEACFNNAFDELVNMGLSNTNPIVFNKSDKIYSEPNCVMNMKAVYRYMAYQFICHSSIINDHTLQLNEAGVTMFSSCPENVQTWKAKDQKANVHVNFKYRDHFTPPAGKELSKGIDPVLAKTIWLELTAEEKEIFLHLLLEPLIPDENEVLKQHLEIFKNDTDSMKKVRACYELVCDMGEAIDKKFGRSLGSQWLEKADDYDEAVTPLIKTYEVLQLEEEDDKTIVQWKIDIESFNKVDPNFAKMILNSQNDYKQIWSNMSAGLLQKPYSKDHKLIQLNQDNFKSQLRDQFHVWYQMLDGHYCLLSALCALTLTDSKQFTAANVTKIHHAMANHLDNEKVADKYKDLIMSEHHMTVAQYQAFLRQNKLNQFLGDTEIAVFASLMGVRVLVFFPEDAKFNKTEIDEHGLRTPISNMNQFGPNTKECLYLTFQSSGANYYYTFPRLKTNVLEGQAGAAVSRVENFWRTVRHSHY